MALISMLIVSLLAAPGPTGSRIGNVKSWIYVLQGAGGKPLPVEALVATKSDLLVIEPTHDGKWLTREEVERLGANGRVVLAYFSIGEAESYRAYWKAEWKTKPPAFLGAVNADWDGNYKVRYWLPQWQAITRARLDEVADAGFDGAYLDIIDAYEYWGPGGDEPERPTAAADMVRFVMQLAAHVRAKHPKFAIVPQNGAGILEEAPQLAGAYLETVDAIGAEDTFFFGNRDENNRYRPQQDTIAALKRFRAAGKPVLSVDYLTRSTLAQQFVAVARAADFAPYVGVRALDRIVVQPVVKAVEPPAELIVAEPPAESTAKQPAKAP